MSMNQDCLLLQISFIPSVSDESEIMLAILLFVNNVLIAATQMKLLGCLVNDSAFSIMAIYL